MTILKAFADDKLNFNKIMISFFDRVENSVGKGQNAGYSKYDDNSRKFSNRVENTEGKGEIACCEQFHLFPQYFQKTCIADM